MKRVEQLKAEIRAAVDSIGSERLLEQVAAMLATPASAGLTDQQEAGIAQGIADIEAGRILSLQEFKERGAREREERRSRYEAGL